MSANPLRCVIRHFFIRTGFTEVHQLPNGRVLRDSFHNRSVLQPFDGCAAFKAQITALKVDQLRQILGWAQQPVNKTLLGNVAPALVGDAIKFSGGGFVLIFMLSF